LEFFQKDSKFQVFITREKNGDYRDWLSDYLEKENLAISIFRDYLKKVVSFFDDRAIIKKNASVYHNPAADNVSLNLYGINKLANDHNIDIVLHVHFNDYPGRPAGSSGKYNGFAIYVPEEQLPNSRVSIALAESVKEALEKYFPVSNFPGEAKGVIQDQELIAVGSNASREGASMLIEYGYIYEPQFTYSAARAIIFKSLAEQTYLGIKNFFETNVLR